MNTRSSRFFAALLCAFVLAFIFAAPPARASGKFATVANLTASPVLAQVDPAAPDSAPGVAWYANPSTWTALLALVAGVVAVIQNKAKTNAEKLHDTLVLGIEAASKIPEVAAYEKKIKGKIKEAATRAGVEPLLNRVVKDITEPGY